MKNKLPVIILAAGSSTRMCGINKIFTEIDGIPLIAKTLISFESFKCISEIYVVTKEENFNIIKEISEKFNISKLKKCVPGGKERMNSCLNGINELSDTSYALIHDGARPFVDEITVNEIVAKLGEYESVCCGTRLTDTVKLFDGTVSTKTLNRDKLVSVQTPQGVNVKLYKNIITGAKNNDLFTDDTSVMEYGGYETYIVLGNKDNIKITTPDDIFYAEFIAKRKGDA